MAVAASAVAGVHDWFSWVVIVANAAAGGWALAAHYRDGLRRRSLWVPDRRRRVDSSQPDRASPRRRSLWALTILAQLSVFVQAGLGSWLIVRGGREVPDLHSLYGFSALVAVGIAYSYRQQLRARLYLLYGFTGLFLMGLGIRAVLLDSFA